MVMEDQLQQEGGVEGRGMPAIPPAGTPGALWVTGWALLTTAAIPATSITLAPIAVMFTWLINLGVRAGLLPAAQESTPNLLAMLISFALAMAFAQWYLLRRFLPKAWLWFVATGTGVVLGVLPVWISLESSSAQSWNPILLMIAILLPVGLALGLAQWLYLRRFLPNAFWIIIIDVLAAGSILLIGERITNILELMVLVLPGAITGLGMFFLLNQFPQEQQSEPQKDASQENDQRLPRITRIGVGIVALVALFFMCTWAYSASQLALAKKEGIYSNPEEGMRAMARESYSPDQQVKILGAGPNSFDGSQPYIWYVTAEVRASSRADGSDMGSNGCDAPGSFFLQTKEGWVHVPEGAFPKFIGFWMKVFGWAGEGQSTPSTEWAPDQPKRFCQ